MKEEERAYCAGLIDSDGSIFISKMKEGKQFTPAVVVTTSISLYFVSKVAEMVDLPSDIQIHSRTSHIGKRPTYVVEIRKVHEVRRIVGEVLPYLMNKKRQGLTMMAFLEAKEKGNLELQRELYETMKEFNHFRG